MDYKLFGLISSVFGLISTIILTFVIIHRNRAFLERIKKESADIDIITEKLIAKINKIKSEEIKE